MEIPKVFVSYSHDSPEHKKWVYELSKKMIENGVDVILDQWDLRGGGDLPLFMERGLTNSDKVLVICTERYVEKANKGEGGVGYERMILTSELIKSIDSEKIIPVIKQNGSHNLPKFLETKLAIDLSRKDQFEFGSDELIRTILDAPLLKKPKIGKNPFESKKEEQEKSNDNIKKLMEKIVGDYERGGNYNYLPDLKNNMGISRILFDLLIKEAEDKGLIINAYPINNAVKLTSKGKFYGVDNNLISS